MPQDAHGLTLTTTTASADAFDHVITGYLKYRADLPQRVAALLAADPECALSYCLQGYMFMLAYKASLIHAARQSHATAARLAAHATPREKLHVEALAAWIEGELDAAIALWEQILAAHPHDVLALRLSHFTNFWLGRPHDMAVSIERVMPAWSEAYPGYASVLACRCFAQEESGNLLAAEPSGRRAIELDPGDLWAAHAVAHVLEMQGRRAEGIEFLTTLAPNWDGANNLRHHLWWHCALYHLELGSHAEVLRLYDTSFRNLAAPLVQAQPDVYIDVQNAISMLFRLERLGVDVGQRWHELADQAETRIGDCQSAFTLPHWMMALAAAGREDAAARMIEGMRAFANGNGTIQKIVRDYALPVTEAARAHRQGRHAEAAALMRPALGGMYRLGGSHAQQDVLEQLFLDAAQKSASEPDQRLILERVAGRRSLAPQRWAGWREAANHLPL